jgi:hypothetical protein
VIFFSCLFSLLSFCVADVLAFPLKRRLESQGFISNAVKGDFMNVKLCMALVLSLVSSGSSSQAYSSMQESGQVELRGQTQPPYPGGQNPSYPGQQKPTYPGQQKPEPQKPTTPGQQNPGQQNPGQQTPGHPGQQPTPAPGQQYPAPSSASQCKPGIQVVHGKFLRQGGELFGGGLRLSAEQCASTCLGQSECAGATFHRQSQTCYLKSWQSDRNLYDHPEWTSYVKVSNSFRDYAGAYLIRGHDLATYKTGDVGACKAACGCESQCSGYTYHAASQSCFLKNQGADRRPYPGQGWTTGVKG